MIAESNAPSSALLTDLYQLTMLQGYFDQGMAETAVFEFFVRKLPAERNFLLLQILIASKAARSVLMAPAKLLVDFGFHRAHVAEAAAEAGVSQI